DGRSGMTQRRTGQAENPQAATGATADGTSDGVEPRAKYPARRATEADLDRLAWLLDSSIRLPGGFRVGLDGLIGLIPGFGDALGALISLYLVRRASALGLP